jgi:DNA (cytosine-5)-methyltransferase 1
MKTNKPLVAGLFSGIGGIELGFKKAGAEIIFSNDIDEKASLTFNLNHDNSLIVEDLNEIQANRFPKFDILTGGFPCQAFSVAGYRKGFKDPRGNIFWEIVRILDSKKPSIIFLENVKNLVKHDSGKTFLVIRKALEERGYFLKYEVLNSMEYGNIPQNRERIYIVGFRSKKQLEKFSFPKEIKLTSNLEDFIDFEKKVQDSYYYTSDNYMFKELKENIISKQTIYQWRRKYVRENKSGVCPTLTANMGTGGHNVPLIKAKHGIRKLTPRECFNLMGFPKNFKIPEGTANSHLYKQAGNSVVVPVIERIAKEILKSY